MYKKIFFITIIFLGFITFAQSETSWIKKKDKSENVEKTEEKKTSSWIKKKIKENKKEYKKKEKKITKEVKSWIKKKSKDKYIANIEDLPNGAIYFQATNASRSSLIYGYVLPDTNSKLINGFYETSKGFGYFNDGKTTCKVGSTVRFASPSGEVLSQISGECINGLKFTGRTSQTGNVGMGSVETADDKERFFVDVNTKKNIAKLYKKNESFQKFALANQPVENLEVKPIGKYYALLIGNSDYETKGKYDDLKSPKNDVTKLSKLLKSKYDFERVITSIDATRDEFFNKIDELKNLVTDNDYVLIYYSGHGEKVGNERYWIPVNGSKDNRRNWFNVDDLTSSFKGDTPEIPSYHLALLVDSCWFAVKGSSNVKNKKMSLEKLLTKRAAIVMASGNDEFVDEPGQGNSDFAKIIISELENSNTPIRLHNIYMKVSDELGSLDQSPFYRPMNSWSHKNGDFIFIPKNRS